jgi:GAF domain-containing protein
MRYELNVTTGEVIQREPTPEELAQEAADQAAAAAANAERDAAEAARLASKESARAKLAALGLTDEEISAIVGG